MGSYQKDYRLSVIYLAKQVFEVLGISIEPKALIVGIQHPKSNDKKPVAQPNAPAELRIM